MTLKAKLTLDDLITKAHKRELDNALSLILTGIETQKCSHKDAMALKVGIDGRLREAKLILDLDRHVNPSAKPKAKKK